MQAPALLAESHWLSLVQLKVQLPPGRLRSHVIPRGQSASTSQLEPTRLPGCAGPASSTAKEPPVPALEPPAEAPPEPAGVPPLPPKPAVPPAPPVLPLASAFTAPPHARPIAAIAA